MANPYPVEIASGGVVRLAGAATFTDPANQPGGSIPAGVPQLLGPVALSTGAAPQTQTLWTFNAGDVILEMWIEITSAMDAGAAYEIYTDAKDFIFPQSGLDIVDADVSRYTTLDIVRIASFTRNGSGVLGSQSLPSRMRVTTAVTCDKTSGVAGGAGSVYALVIRA